MTHRELLQYRLAAQQISQHDFKTPDKLVSWMGAMQAQDFPGVKWGIGLRLPICTEADVDRAIAAGKIVRTWPMRGTLHMVAAHDVKWMLQLMAQRIIAVSKGRLKQLEIDDKVLKKSRSILEKNLQGGKQVARNVLYEHFAAKGIEPSGMRGNHLLGHWAMQGLICLGARDGKQPTFTLLDEWVPKAKIMSRDEALAEIALRYFTSHGPATLKDFIWWTGLLQVDAKKAVEMIRPKLEEVTLEGNIYYLNRDVSLKIKKKIDLTEETGNLMQNIYLLPGFDEYMLGYTNRQPILDPLHMPKIVPGNNGMFMPTIIVNGRVEGTWKRVLKKDSVQVNMTPFIKLKRAENATAKNVIQQFADYIQMPLQR